ncbi:Protein transport protein Sec24B [Coemansia spiralis]|uniref:2'-phosphotransferase n=2 Tax=Coemansia TaxID=4863 RepID=A0A9W8KYH9_9FUNG|nr:phosphotransferase KptA/Tpt1 [Coemansia spiralis]KAJ1992158.1 Protein transport protein Sec24B [Coemansia umbellata]KAJ2622022.1 Protein transport protein Sec24B [Coemansia sp. RSA 1358]KAJ2677626.1 Protein transport protein Sec24B [Coemansia spiralis]
MSTQADSQKGKQRSTRKQNDSPEVRLSKLLTYILRHGATKEGLQLRDDGSISIKDLKTHSRLQSTSFEQIKHIVDTNDKKRFVLFEDTNPKGAKEWYVRATQGHSLAIKRSPLVKLTAETLPPCIVHGTTSGKIPLIKQTGLSRMRRTHIHFASGLPGDKSVISGMRASSDAFIWIDGPKAMEDGIEFYLSENGVILSEGLGDSGTIPAKYFKEISLKD